jgi:hypothetical protein
MQPSPQSNVFSVTSRIAIKFRTEQWYQPHAKLFADYSNSVYVSGDVMSDTYWLIYEIVTYI